MKRVSSQLIYSSPDSFLKNTVIETDEYQHIVRLINLSDEQSETAQTLFFNGIISPGIISLSLRGALPNCAEQPYVNLSVSENPETIFSNRCIIDFGTEDQTVINKLLRKHELFFSKHTASEIIRACCILPAIYTNQPCHIEPGTAPGLMLWTGFDLTSLKTHSSISIKYL